MSRFERLQELEHDARVYLETNAVPHPGLEREYAKLPDWLRMTPEQLRQMEAWPQWKKDYVQAVKDEKNERKCKKELAPMTKPLDQMTPWEAFCATKDERKADSEDSGYRTIDPWESFILGEWKCYALGDWHIIPIYRPRPEWAK